MRISARLLDWLWFCTARVNREKQRASICKVRKPLTVAFSCVLEPVRKRQWEWERGRELECASKESNTEFPYAPLPKPATRRGSNPFRSPSRSTLLVPHFLLPSRSFCTAFLPFLPFLRLLRDMRHSCTHPGNTHAVVHTVTHGEIRIETHAGTHVHSAQRDSTRRYRVNTQNTAA